MEYWKIFSFVLKVFFLFGSSLGDDPLVGGFYSKLSRQLRSASEQTVGRISAEKCKEYSKIAKKNENACRNFNPDQPWDYPAKAGEFSHMVSFGCEKQDELPCPGSLISDQYVLTTAVCTTYMKKNCNPTWAVFGQNEIGPSINNSQAIKLEITQIHIHPNYAPGYHYLNDIALLKLDKKVEFDEFKRPACLNTKKEITGNLILSGWGIGVNSSKQKVELTYLKKTVMDFAPVDSWMKLKFIKGINNPEIPEVLAAKAQPGKKDTCRGDSGAALITNLKDPYCMYNIIGMPSFVIDNCFEDSTFYTRVSNYIPWIESIVWPVELKYAGSLGKVWST